MEVKQARAAQRRAEAEAKRKERALANSPERKPWLQYPEGSAERYRCRYQTDPAFAKRERERAIVFRFTHPDLAVKSDRGNHWQLAAANADGSVTSTVVRRLLRTKRCYLCGIELTPDNRSIDHRVALTLGGAHTAENLAACCLPCNREKGVFERRLRHERDQKRRQHFQVIDFRYFRHLETAGAGDLGSRSVGEP